MLIIGVIGGILNQMKQRARLCDGMFDNSTLKEKCNAYLDI